MQPVQKAFSCTGSTWWIKPNRFHRAFLCALLICQLHIGSANCFKTTRRYRVDTTAVEDTQKFQIQRATRTRWQQILERQQRHNNSIPHILHQIWTAGPQNYTRMLQNPKFRIKDIARQDCAKHHQRWEILFWDSDAIQLFIKEHYAWFLPTLQSYSKEINHADAVRPFILHKLGGVYLDLDVQCIRPMDISLQGDYDAVLQVSLHEGVNNGMMASKPGLQLWMEVAKVLVERAEWVTRSLTNGIERQIIVGADGKVQLPRNVIWETGPLVLAQALERSTSFKPGKTLGGELMCHGAKVWLMEMGSWFMPCWIQDFECRIIYENHKAEPPNNVMGYHWFASTWG